MLDLFRWNCHLARGKVFAGGCGVTGRACESLEGRRAGDLLRPVWFSPARRVFWFIIIIIIIVIIIITGVV